MTHAIGPPPTVVEEFDSKWRNWFYRLYQSVKDYGLHSDSGSTAITVADVEVFEVDDDTTAGNTRFLIYDVDNATLERVSVGVANSGGSGFKLLRIQN